MNQHNCNPDDLAYCPTCQVMYCKVCQKNHIKLVKAINHKQQEVVLPRSMVRPQYAEGSIGSKVFGNAY